MNVVKCLPDPYWWKADSANMRRGYIHLLPHLAVILNIRDLLTHKPLIGMHCVNFPSMNDRYWK